MSVWVSTETFVAQKSKTRSRRFSHASPYSTWVAIAMLLPTLAVVAAMVWATGRIFVWYGVAINVTAFLLYWQDKYAAKRSAARVPELVLHAMALGGGSPGTLLGQRVFRHKTRKWQFQAVYWASVAIHLGIAIWALPGILTARGWQGPLWTAFAVGMLVAINVATFVLEPLRTRSRVKGPRALLLILGGGLGAAFRDQRDTGMAWLPYLAASAQLGVALVAALLGLKSLIT